MDSAKGAFVIDEWISSPVDAPQGHETTTAVVRKTYSGAVAGTSVANLVLAQTPVEGSAAYVGLERLDVTVDGRAGTFLLLHDAVSTAGEAHASWRIVPDSGTGELKGITGAAEIVNTGDPVHEFSLGYDLP
jgi:hypothetical protein